MHILTFVVNRIICIFMKINSNSFMRYYVTSLLFWISIFSCMCIARNGLYIVCEVKGLHGLSFEESKKMKQ